MIASSHSSLRMVVNEIFVACVTLVCISTFLAHAVNKMQMHVEICLFLGNKSESEKEDKSRNFHLSEC